MSDGIAVAVVTHDNRHGALATLDALRSDPECAAWDVMLVDNGSSDGTADAVAGRAGVRTIRNAVGRGYAGAINQALAASDAPLVAVMTAGTIVPPGGLGSLAGEVAGSRDVAAAGPLLLHPDGRVQRHGLFRPRPFTAFVVLSGLASLGPFRAEAERYYGRHEPGPACDVDQLSGACVVLRRSAVADVGPFDEERFFLYCEDVDWSLRARERGWRLRFVPSVAVRRSKSTTSRRESVSTIRLYYRSLRRFYAKHSAPRDPLVVRPLYYAGAYLKEAGALAANALRREKGLRY